MFCCKIVYALSQIGTSEKVLSEKIELCNEAILSFKVIIPVVYLLL
ncbi:MAG: hypothetical protein QXU40_04325 [Candidatus Pacearchaeota archaeon]